MAWKYEIYFMAFRFVEISHTYSLLARKKMIIDTSLRITNIAYCIILITGYKNECKTGNKIRVYIIVN